MRKRLHGSTHYSVLCGMAVLGIFDETLFECYPPGQIPYQGCISHSLWSWLLLTSQVFAILKRNLIWKTWISFLPTPQRLWSVSKLWYYITILKQNLGFCSQMMLGHRDEMILLLPLRWRRRRHGCHGHFLGSAGYIFRYYCHAAICSILT